MTRAIVPAVLCSLALGCAGRDPSAAPTSDLGAAANAPVTRTAPGGLRQTIRVFDNRPGAREIFWITSVIVNEGAAPVPVTARTCGLDVVTSAERAPTGFARCAGYSTAGPLAPGDSLLDSEPIAIAQSGTHTLRVRHLLNPELWVDVAVTVGK